MPDKQTPAYYAFLGLSLAFSILAVATLLPNPGASKPNVMGYRSVCSFSPAGTALCCLLAGITCTVRNRLVSSRKASTRYQPPILSVALGLLFAGIALAYGIAFVRAQERFVAVIDASEVSGGLLGGLGDGKRRATVTEGEVSATVEVTVSGGRVEALNLVEGKNVEAAVAESIFGAVKSSQSTGVEVVSGATASSQVLLEAIEQAACSSP